MNESFGEMFLKATRSVRYAATAALALLAVLLLAWTITAFTNLGISENPYSNSITVTGEGEAVAIPNIAVFSFTLTEKGTTVAGVQDGVARLSEATLADVRALGIEDKDIKTLSYNVYPTYEYSSCNGYTSVPCPAPKVTGYQVDNTIEVKVRDTAKVADVLEVLGKKGLWSISGPNFEVDDDEALRTEARDKAIEQAKEKAKMLAKQLGVRLVRVISFYENAAGYPMYDSYGAGADMMAENRAYKAPTLEPGEEETTISVSITYEIR